MGGVGCMCDASSDQLDQGDHVVGGQLSGAQLVVAFLSPPERGRGELDESCLGIHPEGR